jgi:hypothetical protein
MSNYLRLWKKNLNSTRISSKYSINSEKYKQYLKNSETYTKYLINSEKIRKIFQFSRIIPKNSIRFE